MYLIIRIIRIILVTLFIPHTLTIGTFLAGNINAIGSAFDQMNARNATFAELLNWLPVFEGTFALLVDESAITSSWLDGWLHCSLRALTNAHDQCCGSFMLSFYLCCVLVKKLYLRVRGSESCERRVREFCLPTRKQHGKRTIGSFKFIGLIEFRSYPHLQKGDILSKNKHIHNHQNKQYARNPPKDHQRHHLVSL